MQRATRMWRGSCRCCCSGARGPAQLLRRHALQKFCADKARNFCSTLVGASACGICSRGGVFAGPRCRGVISCHAAYVAACGPVTIELVADWARSGLSFTRTHVQPAVRDVGLSCYVFIRACGRPVNVQAVRAARVRALASLQQALVSAMGVAAGGEVDAGSDGGRSA
jgi:hypothetical protein